jgi:hypothetical protein
MPRTLFLLLLACLAHAVPAADLSIALPLGPWYRPGKYLPVYVAATGAEPGRHALALSGDTSAARTTLNGSGARLDAIVPYFVPAARPPHLALSLDDAAPATQPAELRPLAEADRLVAWTTPDDAVVRQLLPPGARAVPVLVDPDELVKSAPAAWGVLDLLLLDAGTAARLNEGQHARYVSSGITIAFKTTQPPFPAWPWKQQADYAVLTPVLAGPQTGAYFAAAYLPVADWQPGHPWPQRRRILVVAALCCLPYLALALWRPRFTPAWGMVVAALLCLALLRWQRTALAPRQATGEIVVLHPDGVTQSDRWTYLTTPAASTLHLPWVDPTRPITSPDVPTTLVCGAGGHPSEFRVRVAPHRKLAFLTRAVGLRSPRTTPEKPVTSPLAPLVDAAYVGNGDRVLGQLPAPPGDPTAGRSSWNAVVVERARPQGPRPP